MSKFHLPLMGKSYFLYLCIFLLSLTLSLSYNFLSPHVNAALACDASEYMRDAQGMEKVAHLPLRFWFMAAKNVFCSANGSEKAFIQEQLSPLKELAVGGPAFPLFIWSSFKLFGQHVSNGHSVPPVVAQCILSAFSCLLIAFIGTILWDRKTGILAGFLAAAYPGLIVNSGRLYSETFATFLSCILLLLLSMIITGRAASRTFANIRAPSPDPPAKPTAIWRTGLALPVLLGVSTALLQMTRSVLTLVSVALVPVIFLCRKEKRKTYLVLFLIGFALALLPWLFLQRCTFGKTSLVVDRHGHFTFFLGNNPDTLGWLTFPYPDLSGVESKSFFSILKIDLRRSPERWCKLMLDKPIRLFGVPWNEFRASIGPISADDQIAYHRLLLLLAALGVVTALFEPARQPGARRRVFARFCVFSFFAFHCVYCLFETISRYALPAMPCMILFAAAALGRLTTKPFTLAKFRSLSLLLLTVAIFVATCSYDFVIQIAKGVGEQWIGLALTCQVLWRLVVYGALFFFALRFAKKLKVPSFGASVAACFLFILSLPAVCMPLRAYGRWYEWNEPFDKSGSEILQTIRLTDDQVAKMLNRQSYVMVNLANGAYLADDIGVRINGVPLDGFFIPIMSLSQGLEHFITLGDGTVCPEVEFILNDLTFFADLSPLELRQWFLIPVSPEQLKSALALDEKKPHHQYLLSISVDKLNERSNTIYGAFSTDPRFILMPSVNLFSWEKGFFSAENGSGVADCALDCKVNSPDMAIHQLKSEFPPHPYVRILVSPSAHQQSEFMELKSDSSLPELRASNKTTSAAKAYVSRSNTLKGVKIIRLTADLLSQVEDPTFALNLFVGLRDRAGKQIIYPSKWLPRTISPSASITHLDYAFPIDPGGMNAFINNLTTTLTMRQANEQIFSRLYLSGRKKRNANDGDNTSIASCFGAIGSRDNSSPVLDNGGTDDSSLLGASRAQTQNLSENARASKTDPATMRGSMQHLRFRIYELPNNPISLGYEIY
jgi:4-amino-4-deoxy-L-arabinose transferase-like glycosyltransferase